MSSLAAVENAHPTSASSNKTEPKATEGIQYRKNAFLVSPDVGPETHRRREKTPKETKSEYTNIEPGLRKNYDQFLNDYMGTLMKIARSDEAPPAAPAGRRPYRNMMEAIMEDPRYRIEKELLTKLTTEKVNEHGESLVDNHRSVRELNLEAIKEFLNEPKGLIITTQLLERRLSRQMAALGIAPEMLPPGVRNAQAEAGVINLGVDQGPISRWMSEHITPWLDERAFQTAGRPDDPRAQFPTTRNWINNMRKRFIVGANLVSGALSALPAAGVAIGGYLSGAPAGETAALAAVVAAPGAVLPIGTGIAYGWNRLFREGLRIDTTNSVAMFQSLDDMDRAFIRAETGINPNDYTVVGGRVERTNAIATSSADPEQTLDRLMGDLHTRFEFYRQIGVPESQLDALPEQFIYRGDTDLQPEKTDAEWQKRLSAEVDVNSAAFIGASPERRLQMFREARERVMLGYFKEMVEDEGEHAKAEKLTKVDDDQRKNAIAVIDEKLKAYGEDGAARKRRKDALDTQRKELTDAQVPLDAQKTKIDAWQAARSAANESQQTFQQEFRADIAALRAAGTNPTLENVILNYETRLSQAENALQNHNDITAADVWKDGEFTRRTDPARLIPPVDPGATATAAQLRQYQTDLDRYNNRVEKIRTEIDADYDKRGVQLERTRDQLRTRLQRAEELQAQDTYAQNLRTAENAVLVDAKDNLQDMAVDFDRFTRTTGNGWRIPELLLRTGTVDEVMRAVNAANTRAGTRGWPEAENNNPDNRNRVLRAMAEARARNAEATNNERSTQNWSAEFTQITAWNIPEDQLRSLTDTELLTLINNRNTANPAEGWPAAENALPNRVNQLRFAVNEARNRMLQRNRFHTELRLADMPARLKVIDDQINNLNTEFGANRPEVRQLQMTKAIMERQGEIFAKAFEASFTQERFFNSELVDAADVSFSPNERAAYTYNGAQQQLPEGYLELMNTFFDYQRRPDKNEYFARIVQVFPPDRLAQMLDAGLLNRFTAPGTAVRTDLVAVMDDLRGRLRQRGTPPPPPNSLSSFEVRQTFRDIINTMRDEALALP